MNVRPIVSQVARVLASSKRTALTTNNVIRHSSAYKPPAFWKPAHYDELPQPQGSWQTAYDMKQKKYNIHLIVGVSFFLGTIFFMKGSGILFFNYHIPELPEGGFSKE